jgi:hypothetical protein
MTKKLLYAIPTRTRLAPLRRLPARRGGRFHPQHQRSARFRIRLLLEHHKNRRRILHGTPKTEPRIQRNVPHRLRRNIAQIQRDHPEASALQQQIRGAKRLIDIPAAHPQQPFQFHARQFRRVRIERIPAIDQRARFRIRRSRSQRRHQQTRSPGTWRPANFCQSAARQASGQRIYFGNPRGNRLHNFSVAVIERRRNA